MALTLLHAGPQLDFSPAQIPGLVGWWDATDASTLFQVAAGAAATANGDPVGQWKDKSGQNNHATQASGTNKPTLATNAKGGNSAVSFDGVNDSLGMSSFNLTSHDMFFVFRRASTGIVTHGLTKDFGTYTFDWFSDNKVYTAASVTGGSTTANTSTGWFIGETSKTGSGSTTFTAKLNGSTVLSTAINGSYDINTIGAFIKASSEYTAGFIGEIILYNSELSAGNRTQIQTYLNSKWGVY